MNVAISRQLALHPRFRWRTGMMAVPFPDNEQGLMPDLDDPTTLGFLLSDLKTENLRTQTLGPVAPGDAVALLLLGLWGKP